MRRLDHRARRRTTLDFVAASEISLHDKGTKNLQRGGSLRCFARSPQKRVIGRRLCAEEIIDGHREKMVTLLKVCLGIWGLNILMSFDELRREIRRLREADDCGNE